MSESDVMRNLNITVSAMEYEGFEVTEKSKKNIKAILEGNKTVEEVINEVKASYGLFSA